MNTYVEKVTSEITAARNLFDFVVLKDGRVLAINEYNAILYQNMADFWSGNVKARPHIDLTIPRIPRTKSYSVEFKRTSYVTFQIEAEDEDQAEDKAWNELRNGDYNHDDADWETNSIEVQE